MGTQQSLDRSVELDRIAWGALHGAMGFFIGTGFSKHATDGSAPSFIELLKAVAEKLCVADVLADPTALQFRSPSQIASLIQQAYAQRSVDPVKADAYFREVVAQQCNLKPHPQLAEPLTGALRTTTPAWIVTTNYDLLLEYLLDDAVSVVPPEPLVANTSSIPIYHLHGSRRSPTTIKITEEDYVGLLGPIDYQRLKLPLLLAESITVMLGYAAGDINVRAAMAWAKSFAGAAEWRPEGWQGRVVQALYSTTPSPDASERSPRFEALFLRPAAIV